MAPERPVANRIDQREFELAKTREIRGIDRQPALMMDDAWHLGTRQTGTETESG
jgi:hypothetical protein